MITMTNPTSRTFISYKRTRIREVELLASCLTDRGVPIWQDVKNLPFEHTDTEIRSVLRSGEIGSGILWISDDYDDSPIIKITEVPEIFKRSANGDSFFVCPIASDNLDYATATLKCGPFTGAVNVSEHNMIRVSRPLLVEKAAEIAKKVLFQRIKEINFFMNEQDTFEINFVTKISTDFKLGMVLKIDWSNYLATSYPAQEIWDERLIPAIKDIANALSQNASSREYVFSGFISLPSAMVLGAVFSAPRNLKLSWKQKFPNQAGEQVWTLSSVREESGYISKASSNDLGANDLAVLVSVSSDVLLGFNNSRANLPKFKAVLHVQHSSGKASAINSAGEAVDIAIKIREAILEARSDYKGFEKIHFFISVPAGLAVLIGQSLNTLGDVQTYEYNPSLQGGGGYVKSVSFDSTFMR